MESKPPLSLMYQVQQLQKYPQNLICIWTISVQSNYELTTAIVSVKPSTCILYPNPTRLFKEIAPLISAFILDLINWSLLTGYLPQSSDLSAGILGLVLWCWSSPSWFWFGWRLLPVKRELFLSTVASCTLRTGKRDQREVSVQPVGFLSYATFLNWLCMNLTNLDFN